MTFPRIATKRNSPLKAGTLKELERNEVNRPYKEFTTRIFKNQEVNYVRNRKIRIKAVKENMPFQ